LTNASRRRRSINRNSGSKVRAERGIADVADGSSIEIGACDNEVRFTLELGHRAMLSSQHLFGCAK
jgi:hypothetical protein